MYRYSVDNAITYTSEDFVLFKESPFASWMERLTLENPDHGILPDTGSRPPRDAIEVHDDLADTLSAEAKDVVRIDGEIDESVRRTATLEAMRRGVDFIVNGQLALGALSASANLLMRTSGYSELGNYLYIPCNTQRKTNLHSALRLCFLADLLHSLQGQLPPQMLIIRGDSDVIPLETEDHIYHYRAVKHRFMNEQQAFRKHKMPDPAESSHFGRWSECANEVLRQRALRHAAADESEVDTAATAPALGDIVTLETPAEETLAFESADHEASRLSVPNEKAAEVAAEAGSEIVHQPVFYEPAHVGSSANAYDLDEVNKLAPAAAPAYAQAGATLVEQARLLAPVAWSAPADVPDIDALENLAFIGSSSQAPTIGQQVRPLEAGEIIPGAEATETVQKPLTSEEIRPYAPNLQPWNTADAAEPEPTRERVRLRATYTEAPSPSLRNPAYGEAQQPPAADAQTPDFSYADRDGPAGTGAADSEIEAPATVKEKSRPLDSAGFQHAKPSLVDLDSTVFQNEIVAPPGPELAALPGAEITLDAEPNVQPAANPVRDEAAEYSEIFADDDNHLGRLHVDDFSSSLITGPDTDK